MADDFWHYYLHEHARRGTRVLHIVGTTLALLCIVAAAVLLEPWFLLGAVVAGYGFAWVGHFAVERNRPATFKRPWASLAADWRMWGLAVTGRLGRELEKHGLRSGPHGREGAAREPSSAATSKPAGAPPDGADAPR